MGILLYIIATVLWVILTPINWLFVCFKYGISNNYFYETAKDIDKFGNRNFRTFLNHTMLEWNLDVYMFGDVRETISSVLGKNERRNSLSRTGKILCFILNKIDKDHCKKSIIEL